MATLLPGCGPDGEAGDFEPVDTVTARSQCGATWDAQDVAAYDGTLGVSKAFVARHERRVGMRPGGICSGTLISENLYLSAGHCAYQIGDTIRFNYQKKSDGTDDFSYSYRVDQVIEQEYDSTNWDYAIVRLKNRPGREFGYASIAGVDPPTDSTVTIIGHPNGVPKVVSAGPVVDSSAASHWFRYRVDTLGGNSGSGVLNERGQLVGLDTNGGCDTTTATSSNWAMRMSALVAHSPTLQALARSKILWTDHTSRVSIWSVEPSGAQRGYMAHGPFPGWTPLSMNNNRILWTHTSGKISLWTINDAGAQQSFREFGPYAGWTAVNYANGRILWRHSTGKIRLWVLDDNDNDNYLYRVEYGPFNGWSVVNYANDRILWKHQDGRISLWVVSDGGDRLSSVEHGPFPGWTARSYSNSEILWTNVDGRVSLWSVDKLGNQLSSVAHGPFPGWFPVANADRHLMWTDISGQVSYWTTDSDGNQLSYIAHGPFYVDAYNIWEARLTSGGSP